MSSYAITLGIVFGASALTFVLSIPLYVVLSRFRNRHGEAEEVEVGLRPSSSEPMRRVSPRESVAERMLEEVEAAHPGPAGTSTDDADFNPFEPIILREPELEQPTIVPEDSSPHVLETPEQIPDSGDYPEELYAPSYRTVASSPEPHLDPRVGFDAHRHLEVNTHPPSAFQRQLSRNIAQRANSQRSIRTQPPPYEPGHSGDA